ncbi:MAG TPA: inositol monophosphatase [Dongiaceae bacterium]|nr:inositol monophosphatase [Dongiaceae bacterium]
MSRTALPDPRFVADLMAEVAKAEIVPRFRALAQGDWREKAPGDIVTIADERAEAALEPQLLKLLPGSVVLGEEAAARDKSLFDLLRGDRPVWIIDPIDGTANFAAGKPEFCSMLALVEGDRLLASWIHEPLPGRTTCAVAGGGVEVLGEARPVTPMAADRAGNMRGVIAVGHKGRADLVQRAGALKSRMEIEQVRSLRCAGFDYLRLLAGELDFLLFSGVMPWDHAAGALLVQERGGLAGYLGDDGRYLASRALAAEGVLAAARPDDWRRIAAHLAVDDRQ